jgi:multiple sugar transport system substrate-binding protein
MSLTSREGAVFEKAGWYADLTPLMSDKNITMPDFNYEDFGASIRDASTFGKKVVALPINQEGPLFYWRKDIFEKCKINEPMALEDIPIAAAALKTCDPSIGPWAARGLRSSVPYALTAFINNLGGNYSTPDGKPGLSQDNTLKGLILYSNLLKDYGPPGALNHTFTQVVELLGQGKIAMTHESSNEFSNIMGVSKEIVFKFIYFNYSMSFDELLNKSRVDYFVEIIKQPKFKNYTVEALALEVGFTSRQRFYQPFKKYHGGNPSDLIDIFND